MRVARALAGDRGAFRSCRRKYENENVRGSALELADQSGKVRKWPHAVAMLRLLEAAHGAERLRPETRFDV